LQYTDACLLGFSEKRGGNIKVKTLIVNEEVAERFFDDEGYILKAVCPHCGENGEIVSYAFWNEEEAVRAEAERLMKEVGYPMEARCSKCNGLLIVGSKL
jgi:hypothetical protein